MAEPLVVPSFAEMTYDDAVEAVARQLPDDYHTRRLYAENEDHWDGGKGYIGPKASRPEDNARVRELFAAYDACGEVVTSVQDAFGGEAQIDVLPLEGEVVDEADRQEVIELLTRLWDRVRMHEYFKRCVKVSAYAERAPLRWWIPPGRAVSGQEGAELPRAESVWQAAEWLALSAPDPATCAVVTDHLTQRQAAIFLDDYEDTKRAEIVYVDDEGNTVWRVLDSSGGKEENMMLELAGNLPTAEMNATNLITPAVIQTQRQLDYIESLISRIIETAGFRERYILNAEPEGNWRPLDDGEEPTGITRDVDGITYQLEPSERVLGASVTTEIIGILNDVEEDRVARSTPNVLSFDPTDPQYAISAAEHARQKILRMCKQAHRAGTGRSELSGFAYQQARAAFEKDLQNRKGSAEAMLRASLTAALAMIEALCGTPGLYTERYRITVDLHVDAGPRSPEERQQDRYDVEQSLMSPETSMSRAGVEDVKAEMDRIARRPEAQQALLRDILALYKELRELLDLEDALAVLREVYTLSPTLEAALRNADNRVATDGAGSETDDPEVPDPEPVPDSDMV